MEEWIDLQLGDCLSLVSGGTPSKSNPAYWGGVIPWVSCKDMKVDYIYDAEDHVTELGSVSGTRIVPEGTILFVVRGMILAREFPVALSKCPVAFNQDLKAVRPAEFLDTKFLFHWLRANRHEILGRADEAGHGTKGLQTDRLLSLPISVPALPIQRRIAGFLSAYDDLIENSQRRIKILEEMARRLYREWFVHFRFPGHEVCRFMESPLGEIPEGWEGVFGDIASIERNGVNPSQYSAEEFDHFSIPAYDAGRQPFVEAGETILSTKYLIGGSAVLLSKLNPRIPRTWLPILGNQRRAITSTEFICLNPKAGLSREFVYAKCSSEVFAAQFGSLAIGTSTSHQRVKPESLLKLPSIVPDADIAERFTQVVSPILVMSESLRFKIQNLRRTRDLLLPRLLSGQIDVEALPEPTTEAHDSSSN